MKTFANRSYVIHGKGIVQEKLSRLEYCRLVGEATNFVIKKVFHASRGTL